MNAESGELTRRFEARTLDAAAFGHREHVQVAWEMLRRYDFLDAVARYANGIRAIANEAGVPDKFNLTITLAFMSLIAERAQVAEYDRFEEFLAANDDLLRRDVLRQWYTDDQLGSELARTLFLLPRAAA